MVLRRGQPGRCTGGRGVRRGEPVDSGDCSRGVFGAIVGAADRRTGGDGLRPGVGSADRRDGGHRPLARVPLRAGEPPWPWWRALTLGAGESIREDLRKPFILGDYMFVTGVRLPAPEGSALPSAPGGDRFALDAVEQRGVLQSALWSRPLPVTGDATVDAIARGQEIFRLSCSECHTRDGYNAVRPLVHGMSVAGASGLLERLARPIDASGQPASWATPHVAIESWRGRRMPPFAGTADERQALAEYLASLGGMTPDAIAQAAAASSLGARAFEEHCSVCHGKDGPFPFKGKGRTADEFYALIDHLPTVNAAMPPFDGTAQERRALADYLPSIDGSTHGGSR